MVVTGAKWICLTEQPFHSVLPLILERLKSPNGRPLKVYLSGNAPLRAVLSIYSMLLNGYRPSAVLVFGEHAWTQESRDVFSPLLSFASIVPTHAVLNELTRSSDSRLCDLAIKHGCVMKTCAAVLYPPVEFCCMDENIFVLDPVEEGLRAFQRANLVYAPDHDRGAEYLASWGKALGKMKLLRTARLGTGLFWLRNTDNPRHIAGNLLRLPVDRVPAQQWEQGFLAVHFSDENNVELSPQRYVRPVLNDIPGGIVGYDYVANPRGFVALDFSGLNEKPSDSQVEVMADGILGRANARTLKER